MSFEELAVWADKRCAENLKRAEKFPEKQEWHLAKANTYKIVSMKLRAEAPK
jgi:hypothetical protein